MVRSLSQWTKTLSFPSRISPNRNSKDCSVNVHPVTPPPAPPRNKHNQSMSPSPPPNVPITEISQIVSCFVYYFFLILIISTIIFEIRIYK